MSVTHLQAVPMVINGQPALVSCRLLGTHTTQELCAVLSAALQLPVSKRDLRLSARGIKNLNIVWVGGANDE